MTPAKQHSRGHRNIIATSARHQQSITKTRPRHHRDTPRHHPSNTKPRLTLTETRPRHGRDMSESMNFSVLKHHPSTYGPQLPAKVHSLQKLEFEVLLRNPSSPKNQNTITKAKKTALQHQRHNTKLSPTHHQNITAPSPHITETSPNMPETSPTHH